MIVSPLPVVKQTNKNIKSIDPKTDYTDYNSFRENLVQIGADFF